MRVLLYTQGSSGVISGVPAQITIFKQKLTDWGYQVDDSADATMFTDANLAKYAAVGMINTCFYPFGNNNAGTNESMALQKFLQQGGGLFGTHCADVTFTSAATMPLYNKLLGGWAHSGTNSGDNGSLTCTKKADHPTSTMLPATFMRTGNVDVAEVTQDATVLVECKYGSTTHAGLLGADRDGRRARLLHQLWQDRCRAERRHHRRQAHHRRPRLGFGPLAGATALSETRSR